MSEIGKTRHEMVLEKIHRSGVEEWFCPICGRRFLLRWPPDYLRIVIEPGEDVIHVGGKGNLESSNVEAEVDPAEEARLEPFASYINSLDLSGIGKERE